MVAGPAVVLAELAVVRLLGPAAVLPTERAGVVEEKQGKKEEAAKEETAKERKQDDREKEERTEA